MSSHSTVPTPTTHADQDVTSLPPYNPESFSPNEARKQEAAMNLAFAKYYWPRHFERGPVDPASFLDRLFTDYTDHERDIIGDWTQNMSPVYKIYKVCLQYGRKNGTPAKAADAKKYQGVLRIGCTGSNCKRTLAREAGVQEVRNKHRQLTAETRLFGRTVGRSTPSPPVIASPTENFILARDAAVESSVHYPPATPRADPAHKVEPPPRGTSLKVPSQRDLFSANGDTTQASSLLDPEDPFQDVGSSIVQVESSTLGANGQSPPARRVRKSRSKKHLAPTEYDEPFEALRRKDGNGGYLTQTDLQRRVSQIKSKHQLILAR